MARQRYLVLGSGLEFCAGSLPCHDQEVSRNGYGKGQQESAGYGRNFPAYFYGLDGKAKIFLFPVHGYIYIMIRYPTWTLNSFLVMEAYFLNLLSKLKMLDDSKGFLLGIQFLVDFFCNSFPFLGKEDGISLHFLDLNNSLLHIQYQES